MDYFRQENRKGGNRRNLSYGKEAELLSGFQEHVKKGVLVSVQDIKARSIIRWGMVRSMQYWSGTDGGR